MRSDSSTAAPATHPPGHRVPPAINPDPSRGAPTGLLCLARAFETRERRGAPRAGAGESSTGQLVDVYRYDMNIVHEI